MKIKRLLAFVTGVAMIVGMIPTFVFANEIDFEADEPETTESSEVEEEDEEEPEEEPAESEDAEEPEEAEDNEAEKAIPEESIVVGEAPANVPAVTDSKTALGGRIGSSKVYWSYSANTLTVYGKGKMPSWKSAASVPWHSYRSQIKYLYVRSGITSIGNFAFCDLVNLKGGSVYSYLSGKNALKTVGAYAFSNTPVGKPLTFKTITSFGSHAYDGSMLSTFTIPKNVKSLGAYAFANNPNLKAVGLNAKIKTIPGHCFENCGLTNVNIPKQVKTIGAAAYRNCTVLASVKMGKNVSTIGSYAFAGCSKLPSFAFPAKVKTVSEGVLANCTSLTSVKLSSKSTSIGKLAFGGCPSLASIAIPGLVKVIGDDAFNSCKALTTVRIPGKVATIGPAAFYNCTSLSSVTICGGVKTIGTSAFANTALTSVIIPSSVATIGETAFSKCTKLTSVTLNYGIKNIGAQAFASCSKLKSISIPSSVTILGDKIFNSCSGLTIYRTPEIDTAYPNALSGVSSKKEKDLEANSIAAVGKVATVKAKKVKKKAQKIGVSKLYTFTDYGVGGRLFAKASGNKKISVASNGVITVKKGLKKGTYTVKVKVMATGDLTHRDSGWQIVTVKVKVK